MGRHIPTRLGQMQCVIKPARIPVCGRLAASYFVPAAADARLYRSKRRSGANNGWCMRRLRQNEEFRT